MRDRTPEQQAKAEARKLKFRQLVKQVGDMSAVQKAELAAKMGAILTADGRALSLHNTLLLCLQCPGATIVGGFKQWLKHGRAVAKGQHGHMIWFPRNKGKAEDTAPASPASETEADNETKESVRFMIGTVFDISQTIEIESTHSAEPAAPCVALVPAVPANCPRCKGETEFNGNGGISCFFCGYNGPVTAQPEQHWTAKVIDLELVS